MIINDLCKPLKINYLQSIDNQLVTYYSKKYVAKLPKLFGNIK